MAYKLLVNFSGSGYDPHDVKVIFDPVAYVAFNGMSLEHLREIVLLAAVCAREER
jgi:predicted Holliday junction resolvase-like endonuclease